MTFASTPGQHSKRLQPRARIAARATRGALMVMRANAVPPASALSQNGVRTGPGHNAVTCTPYGRSSICSALENDWTNAFEA